MRSHMICRSIYGHEHGAQLGLIANMSLTSDNQDDGWFEEDCMGFHPATSQEIQSC